MKGGRSSSCTGGIPLKIYTYIAGDMAALVQRGGKLPLSSKVDGSENSCCRIMRFSGEKIFLW